MFVGSVCSGGGMHSRTQARFGELFERQLGWRPYPGSLNLQLDRWPKLPAPDLIVKANGKRFRLWFATVDGVDAPVCVMTPRSKVRRFDTPKPFRIELISPVRLRDLVDEDRVQVRLC